MNFADRTFAEATLSEILVLIFIVTILASFWLTAANNFIKNQLGINDSSYYGILIIAFAAFIIYYAIISVVDLRSPRSVATGIRSTSTEMRPSSTEMRPTSTEMRPTFTRHDKGIH